MRLWTNSSAVSVKKWISSWMLCCSASRISLFFGQCYGNMQWMPRKMALPLLRRSISIFCKRMWIMIFRRVWYCFARSCRQLRKHSLHRPRRSGKDDVWKESGLSCSPAYGCGRYTPINSKAPICRLRCCPLWRRRAPVSTPCCPGCSAGAPRPTRTWSLCPPLWTSCTAAPSNPWCGRRGRPSA